MAEQTPLTCEQLSQISRLSEKRLQQMPLQYVLGDWDFRELTLKMTPPVLIPRPETEVGITDTVYLRDMMCICANVMTYGMV